MEISAEVPGKAKNRADIWQLEHSPACTSRPTYHITSETIAHTCYFGFTRNTKTMEPDKMSFSGWMDNENVYIHTVELKSALKESIVMKFTGRWAELENKVTWTLKDKRQFNSSVLNSEGW